MRGEYKALDGDHAKTLDQDHTLKAFSITSRSTCNVFMKCYAKWPLTNTNEKNCPRAWYKCHYFPNTRKQPFGKGRI